jgi:hypothetical protein
MATVYYTDGEMAFGTLATTSIGCDYLFTNIINESEESKRIAVEYKSNADFIASVNDKDRKLVKQLAKLTSCCAKVVLFVETMTPAVYKFSLENNVLVQTGDLRVFLETCLEFITPQDKQPRAYTVSKDGYGDAVTYLTRSVGPEVAKKILSVGSIEEHVTGVKNFDPSFGFSEDKYMRMFRDQFKNADERADSLKITNCGNIKGLGKNYAHLTLTQFFDGVDGNKNPLSLVKKISSKTIKTFINTTSSWEGGQSTQSSEYPQPEKVKSEPKAKFNGKALEKRSIVPRLAMPSVATESILDSKTITPVEEAL